MAPESAGCLRAISTSLFGAADEYGEPAGNGICLILIADSETDGVTVFAGIAGGVTGTLLTSETGELFKKLTVRLMSSGDQRNA